MAVDLRALVREIPDFPQPGIGFKDITPVLADPAGLDAAVTGLCALAPPDVAVVIGDEARGFLLGPALARELGAGFVLARKPGKPPRDTARAEYLLEYGTDALELHTDAVASGARVLVHDDLLATGGTAKTLCRLVGPREGATRESWARARGSVWRDGRRVRLPHRADVPRRPRAAGRLRRARAHRL